MKNHPNLRHTFQQVRNHALAVAVAYPLSMLAVKVGIAASAVTHGGVVTLAASSLLTRLAIEWLVKDRQLIAEPLPTHLCPEGSRRIIPSVEEVT